MLSQTIIYIVTGYAFINTFHFVALKQNTADVQNLLTSSLVVGFCFCEIAYRIPLSISYEIDNIFIILSAVVCAYVLGRFLRTRYVTKILDFLKIRDTGNFYFWDDLMDNDYPMKVSISFKNREYEGLLHNYESYSNEPHIVLAAYLVKDNKGKILEDYSEDNTRIIILKTSDAENVEIIYYEDSFECMDIKSLCECKKILSKTE